MIWILLACLSPTACPDACEKIVDECGLGAGTEACLSACRDVALPDYERRDFSHCVALADCGELVTGECASNESLCEGPLYIHVAVSPECGAPGDALHGLLQQADCTMKAEGDWGDLGAPQVSDSVLLSTGYSGLGLVFDDGCEIGLGEYTTCQVEGKTCMLAMEEVI